MFYETTRLHFGYSRKVFAIKLRNRCVASQDTPPSEFSQIFPQVAPALLPSPPSTPPVSPNLYEEKRIGFKYVIPSAALRDGSFIARDNAINLTAA